eukprot:816610-Amphidinium_carterae.1
MSFMSTTYDAMLDSDLIGATYTGIAGKLVASHSALQQQEQLTAKLWQTSTAHHVTIQAGCSNTAKREQTPALDATPITTPLSLLTQARKLP